MVIPIFNRLYNLYNSYLQYKHILHIVYMIVYIMVGSFIESQCPSVCMGRCETPTSGCHGNLWTKNILQILVCDDTLKKGGISLFPRQINARLRTSLLWIVGELAGKGLWLWLFTVCTSMALQ